MGCSRSWDSLRTMAWRDARDGEAEREDQDEVVVEAFELPFARECHHKLGEQQSGKGEQPVDEAHGDPRHLCVEIRVVHSGEPRVIETRDALGLAPEAAAAFCGDER